MDVNQLCSYDIRSELKKRGLSSNGNLQTVRERLRADLVTHPPTAYQASGRVTRRSVTAARLAVSPASAVAPAISMTRATAAARTITVRRATALTITTVTMTTTAPPAVAGVVLPQGPVQNVVEPPAVAGVVLPQGRVESDVESTAMATVALPQGQTDPIVEDQPAMAAVSLPQDQAAPNTLPPAQTNWYHICKELLIITEFVLIVAIAIKSFFL